MDEVFVVQSGDDGYHEHNDIIAICSSKEKAETLRLKYLETPCECCDYKFSAYVFPMVLEN